jgi:hypothetical protein
MAEIIGTLIRDGGPLVGPCLFIFAIVQNWSYHSLLRQVAIRGNRQTLAMIDKKVYTMAEAKEYGLLVDVGGVFGVMEGVI